MIFIAYEGQASKLLLQKRPVSNCMPAHDLLPVVLQQTELESDHGDFVVLTVITEMFDWPSK